MDVFTYIVAGSLFILSVGCMLADYIFPKLVKWIEKQRIKRVVDLIVRVGTDGTTSGQYFIYCNTISACITYATRKWLQEHMLQIQTAIDRRPEVLSETWISFDDNGEFEAFDCNFCGDFCPNCVEEEVVFE